MGMLDALVSWSLRNRAMVLLMTFVLVGLGVRAALRLPIDAVPDVTNVQVQVITTAPALSPLEIEKYVSIPVERSMSGIPHVTETRSLSKYGFSLVTVVFEDDVDIWFARQLVGERMSEAREAVGGGLGVPELGPVSSALGEIYQFTVRNDALDAMQIEEMLDWEIAPQLRSVPGVVELNTQGGFDRQYSVTLDPVEMQALGLTIAEVVEAIERSNANAGGGYLEHAGEQIVIGTSGLIGSLEDLERVVLGATPQGAPITVGMVGEVGFGAALRHGAVSMNGEGEVVIGVVMMTIGANARVVTAAVERKLGELQASMPEGTRIEPFYDRAELVERTIRTVARNLGEGALLVILVLLLLLGDLRAGLVVALTIPLSMAFAVICMDLLGMSGNLMSLGAIDFGLIVDGAVIVVENVARRLGEARAQGGRVDAATRNEIVRTATLEVRRATVFGEAVVAIVYVPILALRGLEGKMFQPMAMVVLLALAGAFVLSLSVVPVLASLVLRPRAAHDTVLLRVIARAYRPVLALALRHRVIVLVLAIAALVSGGVLARRLGAEFVPTLDEGDLLIEARNLPAVGLEQSLAIQQRLQRTLAQIPEVGHVVSKIGAPEIPSDGMGINQTDVFISLAARDDWREGLTKDALGDEIGELVEAAVPDAGAALSQPIQMRQNEVLAGIRSDIGIVVYGPQFAELQRIAGEVGRAVADIPGVDGLQIEQLSGLN
ncbi:MAG: efflux RND transporter permease subunit, partial [Deltaproteobacteria bacterium]|nr:efflux RND transporter permease subunit [Nannocystaceae bacterium]